MSELIRRRPLLPIYHPGIKFPEPPRLRRPVQMGEGVRRGLQLEQGDRTYSFDANAGLSDGAAAYAANGFAQYAGQDGLVDLGGNTGVTVNLPSIADVSTIKPQYARIDAVVVVDVTAVTTSGSALEKIFVVLSNDAAFGAGNVFMAGQLQFGNSSALEYVNPATTAAPASVGGSRYEIPFTNEQNNVKYQYVKLWNVISGSGSITYKAFVAVLPEP